MRERPSDESGYTIIEVLVAAAVFAVVFMMIAVLFVRTTTEYSGWQLLTATQLAQTAMEEALAGRFDESATWTTHANGVEWVVRRELEEETENLWTIRITVDRRNNGKTYAKLWTQMYRSDLASR